MNDLIQLSVVSPVYKAEEVVAELVKQIVKNIAPIVENFEIILVEDNSEDNSWLEIEKECKKDKRVKGIKLSRNFGQHAAVSAGLKYAFGEKVVIIDCDLQDNPEDLPRLWEKSKEGYNIVMAKRIRRKEKFLKQFFSRIFHLFLSLRKGKRTDPTIANYAIYDREVLEEYFTHHENRAFSVLNLNRDYSYTTIDVIQEISARGESSYTIPRLFLLAFSAFSISGKEKKKALYVIQKTINITIEGYEVRLVPMTEEKIEKIRQWRNDSKISRYMEHQAYITPEMQQKWFESVCTPNSYYSIIEYEGKEIGLVNVKDIDYNEMTAEGGLFIYNDFYLNSDVSFRVALCHNDFLFDSVKLRKVYIHILKNNKRAIEYNKIFGYILLDDQEDVENQGYVLNSKEIYYKQRKLILKLIS